MNPKIDPSALPLGFKVGQGKQTESPLTKSAGKEVFKVEARQMHHHQKEAVVTEGENGRAWRLTSDEGLHLKGTDLAPFPLGFFNAGIQGDLLGTMARMAKRESIVLKAMDISVANHYWLTGSFVLGTGEGHAEPTDIELDIQSDATPEVISSLIKRAIEASVSASMLKTTLTNTFAIYLNGSRRKVINLKDSTRQGVKDPFLSHATPPVPLSGDGMSDVIEKLDVRESGETALAPAGTTTKIIRNIYGRGTWRADSEIVISESWLGLPGSTHFSYRTGGPDYPSALSLISAGVSFCFMTQLSRYIENMKLGITGIRLVQYSPFEIANMKAKVEPIDTHLFLNGDASEEVCTRLLQISEKTCYLHATALKALVPNVVVRLNGQQLRIN